MTTRAGWLCPLCRARGSIEHPSDAPMCAIRALAETAHAVVQPGCLGPGLRIEPESRRADRTGAGGR